jgi:hypothetical protein
VGLRMGLGPRERWENKVYRVNELKLDPRLQGSKIQGCVFAAMCIKKKGVLKLESVDYKIKCF